MLSHGSPLIIKYYYEISVTLLVLGVVPFAINSLLFLDHALLLHVLLRAIGSYSKRVVLLFQSRLPGPFPPPLILFYYNSLFILLNCLN